MLTKTPDYIISECGYPEWKNKCNLNFYGNYLSTKCKRGGLQTEKHLDSNKLLPLRETLTEYYERCMTRDKTSLKALEQMQYKKRASGMENKTNCTLKQYKNIRNEQIKWKNSNEMAGTKNSGTTASSEECDLNAF